MSQYNTLFDGKHLSDFFGNEGGYNYYVYISITNSWLIMREKTDETEYRFAMGGSGASTARTNRASLTYKQPDEFTTKNI